MNTINFDWENYLTQAQAQISTPEFIISLALTAITAYILKRVYVRSQGVTIWGSFEP